MMVVNALRCPHITYIQCQHIQTPMEMKSNRIKLKKKKEKRGKMSSPPPDLRPPAPLQTAGLHPDLRHAQSLAGPHQDLLRPGDPPFRLARALLQTLTAGSRPTCPPGLTVRPPACRGERNLPGVCALPVVLFIQLHHPA